MTLFCLNLHGVHMYMILCGLVSMRITRFAHEKKEEGHLQPYFYSMARALSTELKNEQG